MGDLRKKMEKLAERWEAEAQQLSDTVDGMLVQFDVARTIGLLTAKNNCADDLRALLATEPQRVRMAEGVPPKATWTRDNEDPILWCWYFRFSDKASRSGTRDAPSPAHIPVCDEDGVWWWEVPHDPR